jgi:hypothetical protein
MPSDVPELLERTRPPDSELVDLIEQAYLEGQIDGVRADLAFSWLEAQKGLISVETLPHLLPQKKTGS